MARITPSDITRLQLAGASRHELECAYRGNVNAQIGRS
jgi:hypothetical protein